MKGLILFLFAGAALASAAKDLAVSFDTTGLQRAAFPHDVPFVGYAADPKAGDEAAAIACRRAGAWSFRTTLCDDETLRFCKQYGLRVFVVLDGDPKTVTAALKRLAQSPHKAALAGVQLGTDPKGGADPVVWRNLTALAARQLPGVDVALPVNDPDSPLYARMSGYFGSVTHLLVDLRNEAAPYGKLERLAKALRRSDDKMAAKLRLLALGSAPASLAGQAHWIMSAFAVDRTSGVFIERPYRADDFGLLMRHLWAETFRNRTLVAHGEGATSSVPAKKPQKSPAPSVALDENEELDALELADATTPAPAPVACANVAAGRPGDVEYLVLTAPRDEKEGQRVCLFAVNTTGERVKLSVDVNRRGGNVSSGWRRRLVPDEAGGAMVNSVRERKSKPLAETLEPGEVTFFDFRF